jgi:hypothetical protein
VGLFMEASNYAKESVPEFLSDSVQGMTICKHWNHVDAIVCTVLLGLVGDQFTSIVNAKSKEVDPTGSAHCVNEDLDGMVESIGFATKAVDPGLVRVVVNDVGNIVLMVDGPRVHRLEVHVEQQTGTGLDKATDI